MKIGSFSLLAEIVKMHSIYVTSLDLFFIILVFPCISVLRAQEMPGSFHCEFTNI